MNDVSDNGEEGLGDFDRDEEDNIGLTYKTNGHQRIDSFGQQNGTPLNNQEDFSGKHLQPR